MENTVTISLKEYNLLLEENKALKNGFLIHVNIRNGFCEYFKKEQAIGILSDEISVLKTKLKEATKPNLLQRIFNSIGY